jgi:hypothetical protein
MGQNGLDYEALRFFLTYRDGTNVAASINAGSFGGLFRGSQ